MNVNTTINFLQIHKGRKQNSNKYYLHRRVWFSFGEVAGESEIRYPNMAVLVK